VNPQGRKLKLANHRATPPTLQRALKRTFLTTTELFGSPLNCSMIGGISYGTAFPADEAFVAITDAFSYRWTGSRIANLEYEPDDILKAVIHALASSESQYIPFLVVLILPSWEDTPWNSAAIRGHRNMSNLIQIPAGHVRFVPPHKQSDEATHVLSPAKWPAEFVLISNSKGRETFLSHGRITRILCPAIQATCNLTQEQTRLFPTPTLDRGQFIGRLTPPPRRSLPTQPATPTQSPTRVPATPRMDNHPDTSPPPPPLGTSR
jgi:hypothetical protein